ncbi:hypothetical protein OV079_53105 [Nannocystis pusilla]|uniref:Uncharacterized protein n=1 Tax=Nannocystis pusilla TaxID=889268 RepID=A0A9X3F165_9BACT|nr:hypothetical protein [Nannocystis pusilla]MCY1014117.1 hypothetical protein [Nannocystis pusilla]
MTHSLQRRPIDICGQRRERRVVIGNGSVLRVLRAGADVRGIHEGAVGILMAVTCRTSSVTQILVQGYDAPGTVGVLAKRTKIAARNFLPLPLESQHRLEQWAAFSVRYLTAWSNYQRGARRLSPADRRAPGPRAVRARLGRRLDPRGARAGPAGRQPHRDGDRQPQRLAELDRSGIGGIDRRAFADIEFDESRYHGDPGYREAYRASEQAFLATVRDFTGGRGAAIVF